MEDTSEEARVRRSIVHAAAEHYDLLAHSMKSNSEVATISAAAQMESKQLTDSLRKLKTANQTMSNAGAQWRRHKQLLGAAVGQHQRLLSLLQAPTLVVDCIRNEMYHEALLVLEHVDRSAQYADQASFFGRVQAAARVSLRSSIEEVILPRLSGSLTVESAFKMVSFLRRLGFSDPQLRMLFLQKRDEYIGKLLREVGECSVPSSCIIKHTTLYKVQVSEVILQYTACFSPSTDAQRGECCWDDELRHWCHARASVFMDAFGAIIQRITTGSAISLMAEQCAQCAVSTGKVHMDITASLLRLLLQRVKTLFAGHMASTLNAYSTAMLFFSWRAPTHSAAASPGSEKAHVLADAPFSNSPPMQLTHWLPLAYALNGLLSSFNMVRKCILPGVELFCTEHVSRLICHIADDLLRHHELVATMEASEHEGYTGFVKAFVKLFYPYVLSCTGALLGPNAEHHVSSSVAERLHLLQKDLGSLDVSSHEPAPASGSAVSHSAAAPGTSSSPEPAPLHMSEASVPHRDGALPTKSPGVPPTVPAVAALDAPLHPPSPDGLQKPGNGL